MNDLLNKSVKYEGEEGVITSVTDNMVIVSLQGGDTVTIPIEDIQEQIDVHQDGGTPTELGPVSGIQGSQANGDSWDYFTEPTEDDPLPDAIDDGENLEAGVDDEPVVLSERMGGPLPTFEQFTSGQQLSSVNEYYDDEFVIPNDAIVVADSRHGIYMAQTLYDKIPFKDVKGVKQDTWDDLSDPDNEYYLDSYDMVLSNAEITINGKKYYLHLDEDLWAIPVSHPANENANSSDYKSGDKVMVDFDGEKKPGTFKKLHAAGDMADVQVGSDVYGIMLHRISPADDASEARNDPFYDNLNYANEDEHFWKKAYVVHLSAIGGAELMNADNEGEALDAAIDYAEEQKWDGLFLSDDEVAELEAEGNLDDYVSGGNHGRYLNDMNVTIIELTPRNAKDYRRDYPKWFKDVNESADYDNNTVLRMVADFLRDEGAMDTARDIRLAYGKAADEADREYLPQLLHQILGDYGVEIKNGQVEWIPESVADPSGIRGQVEDIMTTLNTVGIDHVITQFTAADATTTGIVNRVQNGITDNMRVNDDEDALVDQLFKVWTQVFNRGS